MKLSILIPTIKRHDALLTQLRFELFGQILPYVGDIEILIDDAENDLVGVKRNRLLERAKGKHLCFFDADDYPSPNYIRLLMEGIEKDVDCCSLKGLITFDGKDSAIFEHSIKYKEWRTVPGAEVKYERFPNHISCIRSSIAKQFKFSEKNFGEDHDWSKLVHESGLLKTEHYIPEVIYYYRFVSKKQ